MYLEDFYPVKGAYDEPIILSEAQQRIHDEDEIRYRAQVEQGDVSGAVGLIISHYWDKNKREDVLQLCDFILARPNKYESRCIAYYVQAGLCIPYEEYDKAIEILLKGREEDFTNAFILRGLFAVYYHLKDYTNALEAVKTDYESYLERNFKDIPVEYEIENCHKIGVCYGHLEDYEQSMLWLQRGLSDTKPSDDYLGMVYYSIGVCWQRLDDDYRAMGAYTKAIEYHPEMPEPYNNLASITFNSQGKVQEAIVLLKKALEQFEDDNDEYCRPIWQSLKLMYRTIQDYDQEAYAHYKMICCMGFGFLFTDPSLPEGDISEFDPEFYEDEDDMIFSDSLSEEEDDLLDSDELSGFEDDDELESI
jgi:tetratricopeptide (TPR) repeat protein